MFAVKGWSVDASSLKAQTEPAGAGQSSKKTKKRKRDTHESAQRPAVDGSDVGNLWEQHIEGKKVPKRPESKLAPEQKETIADSTSSSTQTDKKAVIDVSEELASGGKEQPSTQKKSKKNKQKPATADTSPENEESNNMPPAAPQIPVVPQSTKLTPMQSAMRQKLVSARFRHLNETLYTAPSATAQTLFDSNPDMFEDYHAGFRQQVSIWPENPLDNLIATLRHRGKAKQPFYGRDKRLKPTEGKQKDSGDPLPRTHGTCIIADLGCGDARLAHTLKTSGDLTTLNFKLNSYDLHSPSKLVTKADISNLPLEDGSVDIAIFCLALMGTNWIAFIEEAYRILHWKGELWVAEIKSRFGRVGRGGKPVDHSVGNKRKLAALKKAKERKEMERQEVTEQEALQTEVDGVVSTKEETDVSAFVDVLRRRGFVLKDGDRSIDLGNKMFVKMEFIKAAKPTKGKGKIEVAEETTTPKAKPKLKFLDEGNNEPASEDEAKVLKPCLYKIR